MIAYDVNHDGKADVIASSAHQYGIWWFEQGAAKDGSPVFTQHDLFPDLVSETHALIAADINGDGLKDLVTGKRFWSHGTSEAGSDKPARLYWFEASRGAGRQDRLHPARDRRPERHRHPVRRRRLQRRWLARYRHGQQEGCLPARAGAGGKMTGRGRRVLFNFTWRLLSRWRLGTESAAHRLEPALDQPDRGCL